MASQQLSIRLPVEMITDLEVIARERNVARTDAVRRLLAESIRRWKIEHAIEMYQQERVTKERAAEMAGLSLYEMMDLIRQRRIPFHYTLADALEDLDIIWRRAGEREPLGVILTRQADSSRQRKYDSELRRDTGPVA